ncbi:hypothetical protein L249_8647 [Ophiocordyceps polyrhachis-furcata BCC 54312]|uniref:Hydrophobin n=1 Tax=Ophiocordyceps polyrhachis-furcata BCC 54312 TaxID=1330021 RepID=A0A367L6X5_9HYPO|nr:hypothetical protein L249_8647 [Ophiocordyceps polyrhachis-furcata BCC 54312]
MYALQLIVLAAAAMAVPMPGNYGGDNNNNNDYGMKDYGHKDYDNEAGKGNGYGKDYGHSDYARGYGGGDDDEHRGWRPTNSRGKTFGDQCGSNANAHCCEAGGDESSACRKVSSLDLLVQGNCQGQVCCSGPQSGLVNIGCIPIKLL